MRAVVSSLKEPMPDVASQGLLREFRALAASQDPQRLIHELRVSREYCRNSCADTPGLSAEGVDQMFAWLEKTFALQGLIRPDVFEDSPDMNLVASVLHRGIPASEAQPKRDAHLGKLAAAVWKELEAGTYRGLATLETLAAQKRAPDAPALTGFDLFHLELSALMLVAMGPAMTRLEQEAIENPADFDYVLAPPPEWSAELVGDLWLSIQSSPTVTAQAAPYIRRMPRSERLLAGQGKLELGPLQQAICYVGADFARIVDEEFAKARAQPFASPGVSEAIKHLDRHLADAQQAFIHPQDDAMMRMGAARTSETMARNGSDTAQIMMALGAMSLSHDGLKPAQVGRGRRGGCGWAVPWRLRSRALTATHLRPGPM